jgi:hypothetical protein
MGKTKEEEIEELKNKIKELALENYKLKSQIYYNNKKRWEEDRDYVPYPEIERE